ncbi:fumarylacetoacetate hydrolase family protein [Corynebacterium sp. CCM 9185]|uniref:Fumarylacetoacetate hydrolase family protein n=1 Tax=Corynebacterium marambiense TaxID=2765364 RepID=A0ABS0W1I2_9CORY|nr:fumarylacetoacetate hydrolase family protein [Corynebacterium marambiense]MBI9001518.1 fumarylacetoacetate hydrolase family protein [Corynebacterium marambiense]MCK7663959.1 fumarylacetoacetate hydrolase family protein [Corynebacterium marambiense]
MTDQYQRMADELAAAYRTRRPVAPPRTVIDGLDVDGAYRIQQLTEAAFTAAGQRIVGRKIGLTSAAMQQQLGVDSPDFGFFTQDMVHRAGEPIAADQFIAPRIEPELGFRLGSDLASNATFDDVVAAIDETYLAVEIIDSRVRDWDIRLVDTIADNASCGAVVIGGSPVDVPVDQLPSVAAAMRVDGELTGEGTGAAVMGHPLEPLVWLAGVLGEQGVTLRRGDLILTGSFCAAAPIAPGTVVEVDYGSLGTLTTSFT